jgi:hypothetical protein
MIVPGALVAAASLVVVGLLTGRNIVRRRVLTLNGLRYELTLYSNETMDLSREDGLQVTLDVRTGAHTLLSGTRAQLEDAFRQLKELALAELREAP